MLRLLFNRKLWPVGLIGIAIMGGYWYQIGQEQKEGPLGPTPTVTLEPTKAARAATSTAVAAAQAAANRPEIEDFVCEFTSRTDVECKVWISGRHNSDNDYIQLIATAYDASSNELKESRLQITVDEFLGFGGSLVPVLDSEGRLWDFEKIEYHTMNIFDVPSATNFEIIGTYYDN